VRIVEITDPEDPRIVDYTGLTDMQLRLRSEPAAGLFMAESRRVIERALTGGCAPRSALMEPKWLAGLSPMLDEYDIDVYLASPDLLRSITGFRLHRGALAAFHRPPRPPLPALLASVNSGSIVVLEDLVDHTNVGLIFRSAVALGAAAVVVSPRCADPWYRRSVKSSMGAVFNVAWTVAPDWPNALETIREAGFTLIGLTPASDAVDLRTFAGPEAQRPARLALLVGTEGTGLSHAAQSALDVRVRIPMHGGVDSLNVAAAAAIACFVLAR